MTAGGQRTYDVIVTVWTHEEGQSDLSLEINLRFDGDWWVTMPRRLHVL